jgi:triosephosphate isomerase
VNDGKARRPLVAGNWKCHKSIEESVGLAREIKARLPASTGCDVLIAPVFTALSAVARELEGGSIQLGAQDVYWEDQGAFTGEVSAPMLKDAGCSHVIVGHSERRQLFGETDEAVNRKATAVLGHGMTPIICLGETLEERKAGKTLTLIVSQLNAALEGMKAEQVERVVIAYEPIWAIGTGVTAEPQDAQQAQSRLREEIAARFGPALASGTRILYGGSVKPDNAATLMAQPDVDGALVGGASLSAESFVGTVKGSMVTP